MVCGLDWASLSQGEGGTVSPGLALWASEGCCKHLSQVGTCRRWGTRRAADRTRGACDAGRNSVQVLLF